MQDIFETLQQRVQWAIVAGLFDSRGRQRCAFGIWAYAHGQISLYLAGRSGMDRAPFIDNYRWLMAAYLKGQ
jgi:hypothetical protein